MTLRKAKGYIRAWISPWSDQKLAEVYAFNADGKMDIWESCNCIRGVVLCDQLHIGSAGECGIAHYSQSAKIPGAIEAEFSYLELGRIRIGHHSGWGKALAQRRLSAILRAEMRLRSRRIAVELSPAEVLEVSK